MSNETDWISDVITKAQAQDVKVPEFVWIQIESLLKGKLSQRPIPAIELANVAKHLIEGMIPAPPKAEERQ